MPNKLKVTGMTCGHCTNAVQKAVAAVPGVTRVVEVSLPRGEAVYEGDAAPEALIAAVKEAGYQAEVVE
jgi:copper chaperone